MTDWTKHLPDQGQLPPEDSKTHTLRISPDTHAQLLRLRAETRFPMKVIVGALVTDAVAKLEAGE